MTRLEYDLIGTAAKEAGYTIAGYIRHQAVHGNVEIHYDIVASDEDLRAVARELHGIGSNLNQLAISFDEVNDKLNEARKTQSIS